MLDFHKKHGKHITMMVTGVEDPSKYGVIQSLEDGRVLKFIEKPKDFIGNKINAGLYIFNTQVISSIELKPHYLERDLFPKLAEEGQIYCMDLTGYWMDIGQPKDFLNGSKYYLQHLSDRQSDYLAKGQNIIGNVLIHPSAKVDPSSVIGPNVTIGEKCVISKGVRISNSCIQSRT